MSAFAATLDSLAPETQDAYVRLIEERAGIRLSEQQGRTLGAAIADAQARAQLPSPEALLTVLLSDPASALTEELAARLTVPETHFFRVGPQIRALKDLVFPDLIQARSSERRLAIWSAGCSTGEEPYTIAMLLEEDPAVTAWQLSILGTDLNANALQIAREGRYSHWSFRDTPAAIRERYFVPEGDRWRIRDSVRRDVRFVQHNLIEPLPVLHSDAARFDLIICRNVTIYFGYQAALALYERLLERLAPDGWLLLGPCDPVPPAGGLLEPRNYGGAVLWRRTAQNAVPASVAGSGPRQAPPPVSRSLPFSTWPSRENFRSATAVKPARGARLAESIDRSLEPQTQLDLGLAALDRGDVEGAVSALRRATYLNSGNALAQFALARVLLKVGETTRARSILLHTRRLLAAIPDEEPVGNETSAGELSMAVEAQLESCAHADGTALDGRTE